MNKKVFIILGIIFLFVLIFFAGMFVGKSIQKMRPNGQTFFATIKDFNEINGNKTILVEGLEVNDINYKRRDFRLFIKDSTKITWRFEDMDISELDIGDNISVTYTGPNIISMQTPLENILWIQLLDDEK